MIDEKVFRSYDVRGIYPTEINAELAFKLGQAFGTYIGDDIVVGRDMRNSSDEIFDSLAKGVNSVGGNVIDLGLCTTPMLNFAVAHKGFKGGMMITASHNPPQYNGIKLIGERALQFSKDHGIKEIKELVIEDKFATNDLGKIKKMDILPEYSDWVISKNPGIKPFKVVVDCGNGVGAISAEPVFEKIGLNVVKMYFEPDGSYPNHPANPAEPENMVDLIARVKAEKADLGIAFDGDADRAFFVDENGSSFHVGSLLAAIASHELENNHEGAKVYYDLRFSKGVIKAIEESGGVPVRTKVGNPFYKQRLIQDGGLMGAELSGHFMYQENYNLDDGLFSALKVLYWLSKTNQTMSEFVEKYEKGYYLTGEINFEVEDSAEVINRLREKYADGKVDTLDGVTIDFPNWWFNLRSSNTEPVIRLNIEADSQEILEQRKKEILEIINQTR